MTGKKLVFLFSRPGIQRVGMGEAFIKNTRKPRICLLKRKRSWACLYGSIVLKGLAAELTATRIAQPAIVLSPSSSLIYCKKQGVTLLLLPVTAWERYGLAAAGVLPFAKLAPCPETGGINGGRSR